MQLTNYIKNDVISKAHIFEMTLSKEQYKEIWLRT